MENSSAAASSSGFGVARVVEPIAAPWDGARVQNRSAPWARIVPVLAVPDVREAVSWYVTVLGFVEHVRIGAGHRAQLGIDGERAEVIVRELHDGEYASGTAREVMFRVDDVDAVLEAARASGVQEAGIAQDRPYGERQAGFVDPFGHRWVLTQTLRDVDPGEWGGEAMVPRR